MPRAIQCVTNHSVVGRANNSELSQPGVYPLDEEFLNRNPRSVDISIEQRHSDHVSYFMLLPGDGTLTLTAVRYDQDGAAFSGCVEVTLEELSSSDSPCYGTLSHCWHQTVVYDPA